jgi:hypothetical protein
MKELEGSTGYFIGRRKWQPHMFTKATCMASAMIYPGTSKRIRAKQHGEGAVTKMAEASMPLLGRSGDGEAVVLFVGTGAKRVEFSSRITSEKDRPRAKILDREPKSVKFNSDRIITG